MKQKYKIDSSEIKRILEMHDKENPKKLIILEQNEKLRSDLQALLDNKCFSRGEVVEMPYTGNFNFAIRFESKKTPGKYFYAFIDRSIYEYDDDTTKKNFHTVKAQSGMDGKWECSKSQQQDLQAKLTDLKTREGWVAYDELETNGMSRQGADSGIYGEPKIFDLGSGKKIKLYRAPGKEGITKKGYTPEQTEIIRRWQAKGYELADDLTTDEKSEWEFQKISVPGLPENWGMYLNPGKRVQTSAKDSDIDTELTNQNYDLKSCKKTLELYYSSFKMNKKLTTSKLNALKEKTQACVYQWEFKGWGGLRPGRYKSMTKVMRGGMDTDGKAGPSEYGDDAKWRLL